MEQYELPFNQYEDPTVELDFDSSPYACDCATKYPLDLHCFCDFSHIVDLGPVPVHGPFDPRPI